MCRVHKDMMERTAAFARIIRDLQQGVSVDLASESLYTLHDLEFHAELCRAPIAQAAVLAELDKRENAASRTEFEDWASAADEAFPHWRGGRAVRMVRNPGQPWRLTFA